MLKGLTKVYCPVDAIPPLTNTKYSTMKQKFVYAIFLVAIASVVNLSCQKGSESPDSGHIKQTKTYSSDVVKKWLNVQVPLLYSPSVSYGLNAGRYMAYCGVALYESVVPG